METAKIILSNLYSLYNHVAEISQHTFCIRKNAFCIVYNYDSYWPNIVFAVDESNYNEPELDEMCKILTDKNLFPLVVVDESESLTKLLRTRSFMPVEQWTGMYIELDNGEKVNSLHEDYKLVAFKAGDDIRQFTEVISVNLFKNNKLDTELFDALLSGGKVEMIALTTNNQVVGTTMIYYDENKTAGIYMVAANKDLRGKGIGTFLIRYALNKIRERGINICVLQSTKQALGVYQKAGLKKQSVINLFWKVK